MRRRYEANNPLPAGEVRQRAAAHMGVDLLALDAAAGDAGAPQPEGQALGAGGAAVQLDGEGHGEGAQEAGAAAAGGDAVADGEPADEGAPPKGHHLRQAVKAVAAANRKLWLADIRATQPHILFKDADTDIPRRAREHLHKLPRAGQWAFVDRFQATSRLHA